MSSEDKKLEETFSNLQEFFSAVGEKVQYSPYPINYCVFRLSRNNLLNVFKVDDRLVDMIYAQNIDPVFDYVQSPLGYYWYSGDTTKRAIAITNRYQDSYNMVIAHELIHSTMHMFNRQACDRMNREDVRMSEERIAMYGSRLLMERLEIMPTIMELHVDQLIASRFGNTNDYEIREAEKAVDFLISLVQSKKVNTEEAA